MAYGRCSAETGFTCQPHCFYRHEDPTRYGTCVDGTPCSGDIDCPIGPVALTDTCERTPEGSIGCPEGRVCVLTTVGVWRCMPAGCNRDRSGDVLCGIETCLPDPEDPGTRVCWLGGTVGFGEPCESSYECVLSGACGPDGLCTYGCYEEGAPCASLPGHVCRDFVCTAEGG